MPIGAPSMSATLATIPFELSGRFGGFVVTPEGKRRMLLRQGDQVCLLKVPRLLRRGLIGQFQPGESIRVAGTEELDPDTGVVRRIVSRVVPEAVTPSPAPPAVLCAVRVCSKKNCWRNGGRELWEALVRERAARGLAGQIELRQTGCLDRCQGRPNADVGPGEYTRCSPRDAAAILTRAAGLPADSPL